MQTADPIDSPHPLPEITDLQAIDEVNRGNREMFEVLVRRYNPQLYRVGLSYLKDHQRTEDAMQNTYLKAFTHLGNFHREAAFSTWITRIMINECLMTIRRGRRFQEETLSEEMPLRDETTERGAARLNLKEMKALLEEAIAALPGNLRIVYMLREVQRLTTAETAASLGISPGSVKVILHRARERLKAALLDTAAGLELFEYRANYCDPMTARVMAKILR